MTIKSSVFIAIIHPLHRSAISASRVGDSCDHESPGGLLAHLRGHKGPQQDSGNGRRRSQEVEDHGAVDARHTHTHTAYPAYTVPCLSSVPHLSHRTLQQNPTALCVKVASAHSRTIVTKPASRPSPVIDDIPTMSRNVSSFAGGGRKLF